MLERVLATDPDDAMEKYRAVFAAGPGMAWDKSTTFNHRHGFTVTDAERWIGENIARPSDRVEAE